ncbi:AAA domain-containing protein [Psidium guajava]|nr:AAA domain-containing protein [Psidium guajava]
MDRVVKTNLNPSALTEIPTYSRSRRPHTSLRINSDFPLLVKKSDNIAARFLKSFSYNEPQLSAFQMSYYNCCKLKSRDTVIHNTLS